MIALRFLLVALLLATASPASLTNEDIVRMVASGKPEREIVLAIGAGAESFDLSDDMVAELKLAGVSDAILAAMRHRHAENRPSAPPEDQPARGRQRLVVTLRSGLLAPFTLKVPAFADEELKARLALPKENDQRVVKDLAIFLACVTPEHVPDLWRSKTPLGRDMVAVHRHEMLVFVPGGTPPGKKPRVTVPEQIDADVSDTASHDIVLGVAARIGDRWMELSSKKLPNVSVEAGSKPLVGWIEAVGGGFDFKIELTAAK